MILPEESHRTQRKTRPRTTLSTINPIRTNLKSNPRVSGGLEANNTLGFGTAFSLLNETWKLVYYSTLIRLNNTLITLIRIKKHYKSLMRPNSAPQNLISDSTAHYKILIRLNSALQNLI